MGRDSSRIVFRECDHREAGSLETERIAAGSGKEGDGLSLVLLVLLIFLLLMRCHSDNCSSSDCSCQILDFLFYWEGRNLVGLRRPTIVIKVILSGPAHDRIPVHRIGVTAADDQVIDLRER